MAADIRVGIERVEQVHSEVALCVVRCLNGPVSTGDIFDSAIVGDGIQNSVGLRVTAMWRYGLTVDLIDPPHSATLELAGIGASSLVDIRELRGTGLV